MSCVKVILLAEEDTVLRERLAMGLRSNGYQVIAVRDGLGLCDYLESARFSKGRLPRPDVIVSDAELSGYEGVDLSKFLSTDEASASFILLADKGDLWDKAACSGAACILERYGNLKQFVERVGSYADAHEATG